MRIFKCLEGEIFPVENAPMGAFSLCSDKKPYLFSIPLQNVKFSTAFGCFDGVHKAHIQLLSTCVKCAKLEQDKELNQKQKLTFANFGSGSLMKSAAYIIVDDIADASYNIYPFEKNLNFIASSGIDFIFAVNLSEVLSMSAQEFVSSLHDMGIVVAICGYNFTFGKGRMGTPKLFSKLFAQFGGSVICIDEIKNTDTTHGIDAISISSTFIRNCISTGNMQTARDFLGRPYQIYGQVVHGNKIGSKMLFPTANISLDRTCITPRFGVYISELIVGGKVFPSVSNIGIKPTFGVQTPGAESFVLNSNPDLYGCDISVVLHEFLRDERVFQTPIIMREQIEIDIEIAKRFHNL